MMIASGTGTALTLKSTRAANRLGTTAAQAIEDAMIGAVLKCAAEGITDPAEILRRKLAARDEIKAGWRGRL